MKYPDTPVTYFRKIGVTKYPNTHVPVQPCKIISLTANILRELNILNNKEYVAGTARQLHNLSVIILNNKEYVAGPAKQLHDLYVIIFI